MSVLSCVAQLLVEKYPHNNLHSHGQGGIHTHVLNIVVLLCIYTRLVSNKGPLLDMNQGHDQLICSTHLDYRKPH